MRSKIACVLLYLGFFTLACAQKQVIPASAKEQPKLPTPTPVDTSRAKDLFQAQEYSQALRSLGLELDDSVTSDKVGDGIPVSIAGDICVEMGSYAQAEAYRSKEIEKYTKNHEQLVKLAPGEWDKSGKKDFLLDRVQTRRFLIEILVEHGRLEEAESQFKSTLDDLEEWYRTPDDKNVERMGDKDLREQFLAVNMAPILIARGAYKDALALLETGFNFDKARFGVHTQQQYLNRSKLNLARAYVISRRDSEARSLFGEVVSVERTQIVMQKEFVVGSLLGTAILDERVGDVAKAETAYQSALAAMERNTLVVTKVEQADVLNAWAAFNLRHDKLDEAKDRFNRSITLRLETQGPRQPKYADSLRGLADIAAMQGNYAEAESQARKALEVLDKSLVPEHPRKAAVLAALVALTALQKKGAVDQAPEAGRIKQIAAKPLGPPYESAVEEIKRYADLLRKSGDEPNAASLEALGRLLHE